MNITIIRHSIRNRGGDRLVLDYVSYLIQKNHAVTFWTNCVNTDFQIDPNVRIRRIPFPGVPGTIIFTFIKKFETDVLLLDLVVMAFFASFRNKEKILYLAQGYDVSYHKSVFACGFVRFCYSFILHRRQIQTIAVSEGLKEQLEKFKPKKLSVIPNGVDLEKYYRIADSPYLKKKNTPFVILLFTRKEYGKGLDIGQKALKFLKKIRLATDWEVWTIGEEKLECPGIPVKDHGFLKNDSEMRDILSAADIYLVPSRNEGLSLLLIQALACQCVVVTSAASYIIENEIHGLVSPIEDWKSLAINLNRVMEDSQLREKLKKNSRVLAEKYSLDLSCEQFEKTLMAFHNRNNPG